MVKRHETTIEKFRSMIDTKPIFRPRCSCGWRGIGFDTASDAVEEAYDHTVRSEPG